MEMLHQYILNFDGVCQIVFKFVTHLDNKVIILPTVNKSIFYAVLNNESLLCFAKLMVKINIS